MLRLMSAGDLVVQSDLAYEHYNTPRPRALWQKLDPPPPGLGTPVGFGSPAVTAAPPVKYPLIDETELGPPPRRPVPPARGGVPGGRGAPDPAHRGRDPTPAARRRRRGSGRGGRGRSARRAGDGVLLALVRQPSPPRLQARARGGRRSGGDRHQPPPGRAVRHGGRQLRVHRDRPARSRSSPTTATPACPLFPASAGDASRRSPQQLG